MKGNIALYEKNLTTYYLSYYICSNEICRSLNLDSLSNVVNLRSLGSVLHSAVDTYLNECKPWVVVLTQGTSKFVCSPQIVFRSSCLIQST